jgi:hypothetical protein
MNGNPVFGYQVETMIMFLRKVKTCLGGKGYTYAYDETTDYMNKTLVMTLAEIYAEIDVNTTPSARAPAGTMAAPAPAAAPKPAKKKAAKPARAKAKPRLGKKKAAKKKAAKKVARARSGKKKAAKRRW